VDETYVCVAGRWTYLYRVVDSTGATIYFYLSKQRGAIAAKQFFRKATKTNTSCTIEIPASLRSEDPSPSDRNAVRIPCGISVRLQRNPQSGRREVA